MRITPNPEIHLNASFKYVISGDMIQGWELNLNPPRRGLLEFSYPPNIQPARERKRQGASFQGAEWQLFFFESIHAFIEKFDE